MKIQMTKKGMTRWCQDYEQELLESAGWARVDSVKKVEDVINLSREDLQFLIAINAGEHVHNPFKYSSTSPASELDSANLSGAMAFSSFRISERVLHPSMLLKGVSNCV